MRKVIIGIVAIAMLAIPSVASADVPRCAAPVTAATTVKFTVLQPRAAFSQWDNVWQHDYTVMVQPDGSFVGTGIQYNREDPAAGSVAETISGTFEHRQHGHVHRVPGQRRADLVHADQHQD